MKPLTSSPRMGKVKYSPPELSQKLFKAVLYCVYEKSEAAKKAKGEIVYPSMFFLKVENFDIIYNVTATDKETPWGIPLDNINNGGDTPKAEVFKTRLQLTGNEKDSDTIFSKPYPIYPRHTLIKELDVHVKFFGLDKAGLAVWNIEI